MPDVDSVAGLKLAGDLTGSGTLMVGYEVKNCGGGAKTCSCSSGKKAIGGGGQCNASGSNYISTSYATDGDTWEIVCQGGNGGYTRVICARMAD